MKYLAFTFLAILVACSSTGGGFRTINAPIGGWTFAYGSNEPRLRQQTFEWGAGQEIDYLLYGIRGITATAARFTITIEALEGTPEFYPQDKLAAVGRIYLIVQRNGDNMKENMYATHRWWSKDNIILKPGTWTHEFDIAVDNFPLSQARNIGVTFGGGQSKGHGVRVRNGKVRVTFDMVLE